MGYPDMMWGSGGRAFSAPAGVPDFSHEGEDASYLSSVGGGSGGGYGGYASAASQAIATTGQMISQAAQAAAQRDFTAGQNDLDRATRTQLARAQLNESKLESNQAAKSNAYKMLMEAFSNQMSNEGASYANKRNANTSMDQLLASAMLRRR